MNISKLLDYKFNSRLINAESNEKKRFNIEAFKSLKRTGLKFGKNERMLLLYPNNSKQPLYIQYPGKETARDKDNVAYNPCDMRPELLINNKNNWNLIKK